MMVDPSFNDLFPWPHKWWLLMLPLVGWLHRVTERVRGLKAGSASAAEQHAAMLNLTPQLHHQGTADIEKTLHTDSTINNYVFRIQQHDIGRPPEKTWCPPNRKNNRTQKGFALVVGKEGERPETAEEAGDVHMVGDLQVRRYVMGTVRWGVATAASVAGEEADEEEGTDEVPPTVEAIDEEFECQIEGGIQISGVGLEDPGIQEGDRIAYVIEYDGTPVTFGGGSGGGRLKIGTALESARQVGTTWQTASEMTVDITHTEISVQNDLTDALHTVRLLNTPYGQTPNIQIGAKVAYQQAEDGEYYCVSDYTDNPVGSLIPRVDTDIWAPVTWEWHADSRGRNLPNAGAEPFVHVYEAGGTIYHSHCDHEFEIPEHTLSFTCTEVVVGVTCLDGDIVGTTENICVLGAGC